MYTFFHYENDGEKCLPPKMKSQWLFKMSHFHIEHPVWYRSNIKKFFSWNQNIHMKIIIPDETKTESIGVTPKPIKSDFGPAFEVWSGGGINSWDNLLKELGQK